ncbi:MAG: coenzyme F420-0:L-glutamate ligase [Candidatus Thorarchaeota archaeon]|jgi:coenzyme F420-0:L-glutamate ligase
MMQVFPIKTRTITPEDTFLEVIIESMETLGLEFRDGDILGIAETPLGTTEGQTVKLSDVRASKEAKDLARKFDMLPEVAELVLREADEILGGIPHVLLTLKNNTLMANAGVDKSNVPSGFASILPKNPRESANQIRLAVKNDFGKMIGVMIIDSRTQPLRLGNIGIALGVSGFKPVADDRGRRDLFENELRITRRAIADNLASACTLIMGESDESIPATLVRDAPVEFVEDSFDSAEMWISPDECMYMAIFEEWRRSGPAV